MSPHSKQGGTGEPLDFHRAFCDLILEAGEVEVDFLTRSLGKNPSQLEAEGRATIRDALAKEPPRSGEPSAHPHPDAPNAFHRGFSQFMCLLRRQKGLEISELADRARVSPSELQQIEERPGYLPAPRTIFQLERFFRLPADTLGRLCGAIAGTDDGPTNELLPFAACSDGMGKLTREERELLAEFVRHLAAGK